METGPWDTYVDLIQTLPTPQLLLMVVKWEYGTRAARFSDFFFKRSQKSKFLYEISGFEMLVAI